MQYWKERTGLPQKDFIAWLGVARSKFFNWKDRYGRANEHNGQVPRDWWLQPDEQQAIIDFAREYPLEGYRRLTFMMIDADVVAVSPATVYRVLSQAGLMGRRTGKPSKKGTGFAQPSKPHSQWHVDVSYVNISGTFYCLCSVLDGYSRFIVHHEIREQMKEADVETILQRAREKVPDARPRLITDNGSQFLAKDFKEFIRIAGMTHTRTSPYDPQSNGKIERWHGTLKSECIRPGSPLTLADAQRIVGRYVEHYNTVRLHSSLGYIAPADMLAGRSQAIHTERDHKLEAAHEARRLKRQQQRKEVA